MSRAEIAIEPGGLDSVQVVPVADDYWHSLLVLRGSDARLVIQLRRRDIGMLALACAEADRVEESRQRAEDAAAEVAA